MSTFLIVFFYVCNDLDSMIFRNTGAEAELSVFG